MSHFEGHFIESLLSILYKLIFEKLPFNEKRIGIFLLIVSRPYFFCVLKRKLDTDVVFCCIAKKIFQEALGLNSFTPKNNVQGILPLNTKSTDILHKQTKTKPQKNIMIKEQNCRKLFTSKLP